ncbi:MAG: hypothetical protein KAJ10_02450 [Thermodesulfovibrionia bacterium]|nr:hypothetical protein [Thermodesulfovibrionia bacterium]
MSKESEIEYAQMLTCQDQAVEHGIEFIESTDPSVVAMFIQQVARTDNGMDFKRMSPEVLIVMRNFALIGIRETMRVIGERAGDNET